MIPVEMIEHKTPGGRLYWRVLGVAYYSRIKATEAVQAAKEREEGLEIIARLAQRAGEGRRS